MRRVVVLGSFGPGSLATYLARALRSLGHDLQAVDDEPVMPRNKLSRLLAERLTPWPMDVPRRRAIRDLAKDLIRLRPDFVLVVKSPYLPGRLVRTVRRATKARLINWMPDDPFLGLRPAVRLEALKEYDVVVTYSDSISNAIVGRLKTPTLLIPFGYDPTDYMFNPGRQATADVAFVGSYRPDRGHLVKELISSGLTVRTSGPHWHRASKDIRGSWADLASFGSAACRLYQQARVSLNVLHPLNNSGSHNMRTWEIPASGVPMVTSDTVQQRELLKDVQGVRYYSDSRSLIDSVRDLIRSGDAPVARELEQHTYAERCNALFSALK